MGTVREGYLRKSGRRTVRLPSSSYGNPRFAVTFDDGTEYRTAVDAACAYGIENHELDGDVQILLNKHSNIIDIRPLD